LFLWEAFVTGVAKTATHVDDALVAAQTFVQALPDPSAANGVTADRPMSLIGAALMWSGWETDPAVLHKPCLVLKSEPSTSPPVERSNGPRSRIGSLMEPVDGRVRAEADGRPMGVRVAELVERIPAGSWTTYGDIAVFLRSGAMAVATCLATLPMPNAHRVLNAKGKIAAGFAYPDGRTDDPRTLLEQEGIRFNGDRADPSQRWRLT
jgi:alkylated DNA nucleotide flippase Atl1